MPVLKTYLGGQWVDVGGGGGADIPYQNDAPSNPSDGDLWVDKDAIASGSASLLVAETVVSGSAVTSVTFSGLDGNAHGGYVLALNWKGVSSTGGRGLMVTINNDSTNGHYFGASTRTLPPGRGYTATLYAEEAPTSFILGGSIGTYSIYGSALIQFITGIVPSFHSYYLDKGTATYYSCHTAADYYQPTNITSITVTCTLANEIAVGSTFRLYRRK